MNHEMERERELYQSVRSKIKKDIKDVVTNFIHKTRDKLNQDTVDVEVIVNEVSKMLSSSDAYRTLKRSVIMKIVDEKRQHNNRGLEDRHNDWEDYLTNSFASLNSSLLSSSQCSYIILGIKDLQIATKLLRSLSLQNKLQSLNVLRQTSSLEQFISPQVWPTLEPTLKETLFHPVVAVGEFCLDIYVNMMICSSPLVVKESYNSLLEFLSSYNVKENLETMHKNCSSNKIFMQAICITNKFQQCISKHWLRYPQNIMDDIIKITFKQFSVSLDQLSKPTFTNVWTIMTIIDTNNIWLKNWLHGRLSRGFVVNAIYKYPEIIKRILKIIYKFANETAADIYNYKNHSNFLLYEVNCSVCFLSRLLEYSEGRKLICNINASETTSIGDIWNDIVKCILAICHSNCKFYNCDTNFASQAIHSLWENIICTWNAEERFKVLKPLLLPFEYCKMDNIDSYLFMINEIIKLFSAVSMVDSARIDLCNLKLDGKFRDVIDWLTNRSDSEKLANTHNLHDEILINIVKTCRNMLSTPHGILWGKDIVITLVLIQSFQTCWSRTSDCETPTSHNGITDKNKTLNSNSLHEEISKAISTLLSSPLGTSLLYEANYLLESIDYLIEGYSDVCENSNPGQNCICYDKCFLWFCLYSCNVEAVQKNKLLLMFPNKAWQNFSFHVNDYIVDQHLKYISVTNKLKNFVFLYPAATALYNEICKVETSDMIKTWKSICLLSLDDIILVEEDIKHIGSYILCSLVCNMKTFLSLEQKLQIRALLLKCLKNHKLDGTIIIDENSLLWNHILVRSYIVGGPKERKLPPKNIGHIRENYNWPFVSCESMNENYWQLEIEVDTDDELPLPFVQPIGNNQQNFYQEIIINNLKTKGQMKWQHISMLLEEVIKCLDSNSVSFNFSCISVIDLPDSENTGIELAIQYGKNLKLFDHSDDKMKELEHTLKACKVSIDGETYADEFDIFVTTVFLLLRGNWHKTCTLIEYYIHTKPCLYNWILPLQISLRCHKLQRYHAILSQYFEIIMKENLPRIFSAFQICGLSPSAVLWHWTSQCFWNYLDWIDICHWLLLTVVFESGTVLYFAAAIMKHLEQDILIHTQSLTLLDYLKESSISEFQTCDHIDFILKLSDKYHNQIQSSLEECTGG